MKNNNLNLIDLNSKNEYKTENIKYIPSISNEWKNNVYYFNSNKIKNLSIFYLHLNKIITGYFSTCFHTGKYKLLQNQFRFSRIDNNLKQIFISKPQFNHYNSKVIINIYIYNKQKISLLRKIKTIGLKSENFLKNYLFLYIILKANNNNIKEIKLRKNLILYKLSSMLETYKLRLCLNQLKFEEKLLYVLAKILGKFYKKKIEFNIINLKSIVYNSDILTKILSLKLKSKQINPYRTMKFLLSKTLLPKINKIEEKSPLLKEIDINLLENKHTNSNLNYTKINSLDKWLNKFYSFYINYDQIELYKIIFNSIHYKNIGGVRLEIKGRLTRRYRADRAQFKAKWKGGLKNINSSYKRLPSILKRGHEEYNLNYSMLTAKRHVGAFAVKGWISGK